MTTVSPKNITQLSWMGLLKPLDSIFRFDIWYEIQIPRAFDSTSRAPFCLVGLKGGCYN